MLWTRSNFWLYAIESAWCWKLYAPESIHCGRLVVRPERLTDGGGLWKSGWRSSLAARNTGLPCVAPATLSAGASTGGSTRGTATGDTAKLGPTSGSIKSSLGGVRSTRCSASGRQGLTGATCCGSSTTSTYAAGGSKTWTGSGTGASSGGRGFNGLLCLCIRGSWGTRAGRGRRTGPWKSSSDSSDELSWDFAAGWMLVTTSMAGAGRGLTLAQPGGSEGGAGMLSNNSNRFLWSTRCFLPLRRSSGSTL